MLFPEVQQPEIQKIVDETTQRCGLDLSVVRLDKIHPKLNGNKWFKLKHNLKHVIESGFEGLLTFGGQFSNHLHATAAATHLLGLKSIGIVVGNEQELTPTLTFARQHGMQLHFMHRQRYRQKENVHFVEELNKNFPGYFIVPEGGSNHLAVKGCAELPSFVGNTFDYIITACGTGGTLAGLAMGMSRGQSALGISVLKGADKLSNKVRSFLHPHENKNWEVITGFHFGGYAKTTAELNNFMQNFYAMHHIRLEPVYTGKMMAAIYELMKLGHFPRGTKIAALHTGGLQYLQ